jgi:glycosyltransferase involved in cell wall biosynthesis
MALSIKKPKIAILTTRNTHNYGGVLACLKVTYSFCEEYFEPTVFFLGFEKEISTSIRNLKFYSATKPLSYFGMNCIEIGARWAFWEPGHYTFTSTAWKKLLAEYDYFFVVSSTCIPAHPLTYLGKKFVLWVGTPYNEDRAQHFNQLRGGYTLLDQLTKPIMNHIERTILRKANAILAINSYAQLALTKKASLPNLTTIQRCGYPIKSQKNITLSTLAKEDIIIAVGQFSDPRKNITMLIQAFELMHQKNALLKLYVIGLPPKPEGLSAFDALASINNVIFTGQLGRDDLDLLYTKAKLLLLTSVHEGLGIVGLEALLHGTPVIATACGGPQDYVIDGVTGYCVPINDAAAMAEKALYLLACPVRYGAFSQRSIALVNQEYSREKIYAQFAQNLQAVYPELTGSFSNLLHETVASEVIIPQLCGANPEL